MKKLVATLLLTVLCVLGGTATTLAVDNSNDWNDGCNRWWSPYFGIIKNHKYIYDPSAGLGTVEFHTTKWNASSISNYTNDDAWELEWRAADGSGVQWGDLVNRTPYSTYCNLPGAYFEYNDYDDATFGCRNPHNLVAEQSYSGYMDFVPLPNSPTSFNLTVESEWGKDYGYLPDPLPQYYDIIKRYMSLGSTYQW